MKFGRLSWGAWFEQPLERLPLLQSIDGATKRFLSGLQKPSVSTQRVMLIAFPSPEMKAIGLVTRVMRDPNTGCQLAAVYVPKSPNPTSGYIEIVPLKDVVQTNWSVEEAMTFVMTGGTNAPNCHSPIHRVAIHLAYRHQPWVLAQVPALR
jgi:uncharacterized membrane protein